MPCCVAPCQIQPHVLYSAVGQYCTIPCRASWSSRAGPVEAETRGWQDAGGASPYSAPSDHQGPAVPYSVASGLFCSEARAIYSRFCGAGACSVPSCSVLAPRGRILFQAVLFRRPGAVFYS